MGAEVPLKEMGRTLSIIHEVGSRIAKDHLRCECLFKL